MDKRKTGFLRIVAMAPVGTCAFSRDQINATEGFHA